MRGGVTLFVLAAVAACETRRTTLPAEVATPVGPRPAARLLIITGLAATTEPCGCTSKPLGGLDRVAARIEALRGVAPAAVVVAGDTFYDASPPAGWTEPRAALIAEVLRRLAPAAVVLGPRDEAATHAAGLPVLDGATPELVIDLGPMRLGVIRADSAGDAATLRQQGVDLVLAMTAPPSFEARSLAATAGADVVVAGGSTELAEPRQAGGSLLVEAGDRGRFLGVLDLFAGDGVWTFYDPERSRRLRAARIARLRVEIAALPEGPARAARQAKIEELARTHGAAEPPPAGRYFTWRAEPVTQDVQPAPWARDLLADYNRSLCKIVGQATADKQCAPPATPADRYVGSRVCYGCHEAAYAVYERTAHAHAWRTLTRRGKECDPGCIGCHSAGFEEPGGYCRLRDARHYQNVGCESCHGPGGGHARAPYDRGAWSATFTRGGGADICTGCHDPEHSDLFDYATYLPKILGPGHGRP